jgi:hypothetical protein
MDPREPFSEESLRYAAECRRLARLARKPIIPDSTGTVAYLRLLAWVRDIQAQYVNPSRHQQFFGRAAGPGHR